MTAQPWCRRVFRGIAAACALGAVAAFAPAQAGESDELIWGRVASGMRIVDPENPQTVTWARHYARDPAQLAQMLARSEPFLWYIVEAVELRDLPLEIALLPAVESGFNPDARSAQRARGLWQFVPWTGRAMGLANTATYDARRDPIDSTRAALTYLTHLHDRFGDWLLAVAAYNVGEARLANAIRDQGTNNFWNLDLPDETRDHVPRLLGVALAVMQPARFGLTLPAIPNRHLGELVELDGPRDIASAAREVGIPLAVIEQYNPGLLDTHNSRGKKVLLLPPEQAQRMRAELARAAYAPRVTLTARSAQAQHVVRKGDSLWSIARQYRVSMRELADWNDLSLRPVLRPGRKLVIAAS